MSQAIKVPFFCVLLGGLAATNASADTSPAELKERLTTTFAKYATLSKSFQGTIRGHFDSSSPEKKVTDDWATHIKQGSGGAILQKDEESRKTQKPTATVRGHNSKYSFELGRTDEWILHDLKFKPKEPVRSRIDNEIFLLISPHYRLVHNEPTHLLLDKKDFRLISLTDVEKLGRRAVAVEYAYETMNNKQHVAYAGKALIDLEEGCITKNETMTTYDHKTKIAFTMVSDIDWMNDVGALIKRASSRSEGKDYYREIVFDFSLSRNENLPERELTLSAFGLPEPQGITWAPAPRYSEWLVLAGAVVLLMAIGFAYLRRRHRLSAPESTGSK